MGDEKLSLTEQEKGMWGFRVFSQSPERPIFRPFAMYRKDLDQIVVQVRDRGSVTEIKVGDTLTLLEDNNSETGEDIPAGFVVERACVYCAQQGLIHEGRVNLHEVLDSFSCVPYYYLELDIAVAHDILNDLKITHLLIVI